MNEDSEAQYEQLKGVPPHKLIENIAAGPGGGMPIRYHTSVQELARRNRRLPIILSVLSLVISLIALFWKH